MDLAVDVALDNGALGARMMGGGFGGSGIFLLPKAEISKVVTQIESAFAAKNYTPPKSFIAEPSAGARIDIQ